MHGMRRCGRGCRRSSWRVAKNYAAVNDLKDVEDRLVGHLLRIEAWM